MNALELQRRALSAVARLSLFAGFASVAGCGGTVVVESDDPLADTETGTTTDTTETGTTTDTTDTASTTSTEPDTSCFAAPAEPDTCCNALLLTSFSDDHLFVDPGLATDQEQACCELAVDTADTWSGAEPLPFDWSNVSACCSGVVTGGWEEHPACTPWGPPMPPSMPRRWLRRFAMQAVLA